MNFYYWMGYHLSRLAGRIFFRFRVIHRERMIQSGPVILAMNQEGVDRSAIKAVIRVLQAGNGVLVFPEGSRTLDGTLQPAEPGMGLVIAKTLAPVVPLRIFGAREALPRSGGRLRFVPITVVIGEPIFFSAADIQPGGKDLYARLSDRVMKAIAALHVD